MKLLVSIPIFLLSMFAIAGAQNGDERDLLQFLKKNAPAVHESVLKLRDSAPADYQEALKESEEARMNYERVRRFSQEGAAACLEMFRIDYFAIGVADEIVLSKDPAERARLKADLTRMIEDSFDQWVIYERARIEQLERAIQQSRKKFEEEAGAKADVVAHDVEQLLEASREHRMGKGSPK